MLHRIVLSLVFTFGSGQPLTQVLLAVMFCASFGMLHTAARPMRDGVSNAFQSVLLLCLTITTGARGLYAAETQLATMGSTANGYVVVTLVFGYVVPLLGLVGTAVWPAAQARWCRRPRRD